MESAGGPFTSTTSTTNGGGTPSGKTTTTTPSSSSVARLQQSMQSSTAIPVNTSSSGPHPLYSDDGEAPEEAASYYEHWASPTEVLQLRSLCSDLVQKHKAESDSLRRDLAAVQRERDALLNESHETQRMRQMYAHAHAEYEKAQKERSKWGEEREMMRLQLQRLTVENERLRLALQRGQVSLRGVLIHPRAHSPPTARATSTTTTGGATSGSTIPTPSPIGSSSPYDEEERGLRGAIAARDTAALREQLRLLESLHRCNTAHAELEARHQFSEALWEMSASRLTTRLTRIAAENASLHGQVRSWRDAADAAGEQQHAAETQLRDCRAALAEAEVSLRAAHAAHRSALESEQRAARTAAHAAHAAHREETAALRAQLEDAVADGARGRATLQQALDDVRAAWAAERSDTDADVSAAESKRRAAVDAWREADAKHAAREADAQHALSAARAELAGQRERAELAESAAAGAELALRAETERAEALRARADGAEAEVWRLRGALAAAAERLHGAEETVDALAVARKRAEETELELAAEREHTGEQLRLHQTALLELQERRDGEVRRLTQYLERMRRRCERYKIRLSAVAKGITKSAEIVQDTEEEEAKERDNAEDVSSGGAVARGTETTDAVSLLRQSAALAASLAMTIHRTP